MFKLKHHSMIILSFVCTTGAAFAHSATTILANTATVLID